MLSALTQFLSNWSHYVAVDGCPSNLVNLVSEVTLVSVLGPLLFLFYTSKFFSENLLYGYADDSTLVVVEPSSLDRVAVVEFLNRDLN